MLYCDLQQLALTISLSSVKFALRCMDLHCLNLMSLILISHVQSPVIFTGVNLDL